MLVKHFSYNNKQTKGPKGRNSDILYVGTPKIVLNIRPFHQKRVIFSIFKQNIMQIITLLPGSFRLPTYLKIMSPYKTLMVKPR